MANYLQRALKRLGRPRRPAARAGPIRTITSGRLSDARLGGGPRDGSWPATPSSRLRLGCASVREYTLSGSQTAVVHL